MENHTVSEAAALRSSCVILARLWMRELDVELAHALNGGELRAAFTEAGGVVPATDPATLEELSVDFCQLFVGPANHLPPVQSVWLAGRYHSEVADSMKHYMSVIGYDPAAIPNGVMVDHLGVQIDVFGYLMGQLSTEHSVAGKIYEIGAAYHRAHLEWSRALLNKAESRATTEFYRSVMKLTREFLFESEWFPGP